MVQVCVWGRGAGWRGLEEMEFYPWRTRERPQGPDWPDHGKSDEVRGGCLEVRSHGGGLERGETRLEAGGEASAVALTAGKHARAHTACPQLPPPLCLQTTPLVRSPIPPFHPKVLR